MSYGLEIWDGSGNKTLNISDSLFRYVGTYSTGNVPPNGSVTINVTGMVNDSRWFFDYSGNKFGETSIRIITGGVRVTNNTIITQPNLHIEVFRR